MATIPVPEKRGRGRPSKEDQARREQLALMRLQETDETDDQRVTRIAERFSVMHLMLRAMIRGQLPSLIISGAAGIGKTHTATQLLDSAKDSGQINYGAFSAGTITPPELYRLFYTYRHANDIILLDDSDNVYDNDGNLSLLKAATDGTRKSRRLSHLADNQSFAADNIPNTFEYHGSLCVITNRDMQRMIDLGTNKDVPHMKAIMSRATYLDTALHTPRDLMAWINHMVMKQHILVQNDCTHAQEQDVMRWVNAHFADMRELSLRTVVRLARTMVMDPQNWELIARVTLLR